MYSELLQNKETRNVQVSFIWNRNRDAFLDSGVPENLILENLDKFIERFVIDFSAFKIFFRLFLLLTFLINCIFVHKTFIKHENRDASLIVEVCHPSIVKQYGEKFLKHCDFMVGKEESVFKVNKNCIRFCKVGSPTALADEKVEIIMKNTTKENNTRLFIATGAFWGASDIKKMDDSGDLEVY